ncbi:MAG: hypothetical protein E7645_08885 [Ruminococcaceae bacterium]|nr:hypothetical protein [Oscillospiraceae bacterium]
MSLSITYWYGIRKEYLSRERLIEAKDAGFNLIECAYDTETNKQVLTWCEELDLKANVNDPRMGIALAGGEGWESALDAVIADYRDYPAVNRFFMKDEPVDEYFPTLGRVARYLHEHDPRHGEYINFLPHHAVPQIEGMDVLDRYNLHMDRYIAEVQPSLLSYDHYSLTYRQVDSLEGKTPARLSEENIKRNGWEGNLYEAVDAPNFYDNLMLVRNKAAEVGVPWMAIILLVEHWHYRWPTEGEVRWEAFSALAHGVSALSYFTYWTPGTSHTEPWSYHNGIILSDGTRGEKYEIVKAINRDLQILYQGLELPLQGSIPTESHKSVAVYHIGDEVDRLATPFVPFGKVEAIATPDGGTPRAVCGVFGDSHRFILVNKNHDAPVTMEIRTNSPLWHLNKITQTWDPCDGTYTFAPGDGELFAC